MIHTDALASVLHDGGGEPHGLLEDFREKAAVSFVSCHLGDRHWDDLLGQRAPCADNTVNHSGPAGAATFVIA